MSKETHLLYDDDRFYGIVYFNYYCMMMKNKIMTVHYFLLFSHNMKSMLMIMFIACPYQLWANLSPTHLPFSIAIYMSWVASHASHYTTKSLSKTLKKSYNSIKISILRATQWLWHIPDKKGEQHAQQVVQEVEHVLYYVLRVILHTWLHQHPCHTQSVMKFTSPYRVWSVTKFTQRFTTLFTQLLSYFFYLLIDQKILHHSEL